METHKVEVVVADPHLLDAKVAAIRNAGPPKLKVSFPPPCFHFTHCLCFLLQLYVCDFQQVIADFDATLTKYRVNGCRGQSRLSLSCVCLLHFSV